MVTMKATEARVGTKIDCMKPWNVPLALVGIAETATTLTLTQTRAPVLRDLRNLLIKTWQLPFVLFAAWFAYSSEYSSPFWNHGQKTSLGGWDDPLCLWGLTIFGLPLGCMLLRSICSLFGKATFVFDKGHNVLLRNGKPIGTLREICAIKSQITKGWEHNPVFRLVLDLPQRRNVVIAETHYIPGRGEFRVSRNRMGPASAFVYLNCWLDYDAQHFVPFLDPEIAEIERRITLFLER